MNGYTSTPTPFQFKVVVPDTATVTFVLAVIPVLSAKHIELAFPAPAVLCSRMFPVAAGKDVTFPPMPNTPTTTLFTLVVTTDRFAGAVDPEFVLFVPIPITPEYSATAAEAALGVVQLNVYPVVPVIALP